MFLSYANVESVYTDIVVLGNVGCLSEDKVRNGDFLDNVLVRAREISTEWGRFRIGGKSLLYAIVHEEECDGAKILRRLKFDVSCLG